MSAESDHWNPGLQTAPPAVLEDMHFERIRRMVAFAYTSSSLHRRLYDAAGMTPDDIKTWDDYHHRLPFTDKPDYLAEQERLGGVAGLALGEEHWAQRGHTTGTTGRFLQEAFTSWEIDRLGAHAAYGFWDNGVRATDSVYVCADFGMWVFPWGMEATAKSIGMTLISGAALNTEQRIAQILDYRPTVLCATPTYLMHLGLVARERGENLSRAGVKVLTGGGEAGFSVPATRRRLEELFGTSCIVDIYGISEALSVAISCGAEANGVHWIEDCGHSYAADVATGEPVADGEVGEHIITSYNRVAQPFIKYRTHDLVRKDRHPDHGCGWTFSFLEGGVLGRSDFMVTIRGVNVYPTAVEEAIGRVHGLNGVCELHITRRDGMDAMLVKVEANRTMSDATALSAELERSLREQIGVRLEIEVLETGALPRYELKTRRLFDHRNEEERPRANLGIQNKEGT